MDFKDITKRIKNFGKNEPTYWGCALAGEVGEACNIIKKLVRDGMDSRNKEGEFYIDLLPAELADVFIYLELTARHFDFDFEAEITKKLDEIDKKRGWT
jgi:NTP pyrophosphatase (non-canonical NTP hydrolase)